MDYQTPGVYIRGSIAARSQSHQSRRVSQVSWACSTSIPPRMPSRLLGAMALSSCLGRSFLSWSTRKARLSATPARPPRPSPPHSASSAIKSRTSSATLRLHGAAKSGAKAPKLSLAPRGEVKITWEEASTEVADVIMDVKGKVVTENDQLVEELLNQLHDSFALETAAPKTASDVLEVYGLVLGCIRLRHAVRVLDSTHGDHQQG